MDKTINFGQIRVENNRLILPGGSVAYRRIATNAIVRRLQTVFGGKKWIEVGFRNGNGQIEEIEVNFNSLKGRVEGKVFQHILRTKFINPVFLLDDQRILEGIDLASGSHFSTNPVDCLRRADGKVIYVREREELAHGGFKVWRSLYKFNLRTNRLTNRVTPDFDDLEHAKEYKKENAYLEQFAGSAYIMKAAKGVELVGGKRIWVQERAEIDLRMAIITKYITPQMHMPIALKMASGVKALHDRGVIHRDIKPGNYLLQGKDKNGVPEIKLTDFGFATKEGTAKKNSGTNGYRAPEGNFTKAADIYQLGQSLFVVVTGFKRGPERMMRDSDFKEVNLNLKNLILRCVDLDPKKRPTINEVVLLLKMMSGR